MVNGGQNFFLRYFNKRGLNILFEMQNLRHNRTRILCRGRGGVGGGGGDSFYNKFRFFGHNFTQNENLLRMRKLRKPYGLCEINLYIVKTMEHYRAIYLTMNCSSSNLANCV